MGDLSPEPVQFKIEPIFIPAADIARDGKCPDCRGFCDIWKCSMITQSGTRRLVAVKSVRVLSATDTTKLKAIGKRVRREAYIWILLEHDHILPLEGVTVAEEFGPLPALVCPWMEEGSLEGYLQREFAGMSDPRKRELIWQVTAGISYLHSKGVVHGDLTATNILVDSSGCLRLAYFGLSMILAEAGNGTFNSCHPGNMRWMPPEALQAGGEYEDEDEAKYQMPTKAWDVYSYGCVALQIFSGDQPYAWATSSFNVMNAIQTGCVPFKGIQSIQSGGVPSKSIQSHAVYRRFSHAVHQQFSNKEYQQFLPCLNKMSADRPTMDDIKKVLGF
jgi:serine/threonine protein kinase